MEEYKWARFLTGNYANPVIRINNAMELKKLQDLAKKNNLFYWKDFAKRKYREILHMLEINSNQSNFYKYSNGGKSFLVEYQAYKGFTFALLNEYDNDRREEGEWEIVKFSKIFEELNKNRA